MRFDLPRGKRAAHGMEPVGDPSAGRRILKDIVEGTYVYFVHSYYVVPKDSGVIATETDYGGPFCSMIWRDNVFASQFHPEKSQAEGLRILKNFAELP